MDRELIAYFDERFRELREESSRQFGQLRERFDQRFDKVEQRLDKVEQRLDQLEQRVDQLSERVEQVEQRLDKVEQRVEQVEQRLSQRIDQLSERVEQLADTVHGTQIMVEHLRGKIELVAEGVVGVNERLDLSREDGKEEAMELRNLFTFPVKKLDGRVRVVEERTTRHTRQIAALRRRSEKPRSRPS